MHFNLSEERKMLKESCDRLLIDHYTQYKNHHEASSLMLHGGFYIVCNDQ